MDVPSGLPWWVGPSTTADPPLSTPGCVGRRISRTQGSGNPVPGPTRPQYHPTSRVRVRSSVHATPRTSHTSSIHTPLPVSTPHYQNPHPSQNVPRSHRRSRPSTSPSYRRLSWAGTPAGPVPTRTPTASRTVEGPTLTGVSRRGGGPVRPLGPRLSDSRGLGEHPLRWG